MSDYRFEAHATIRAGERERRVDGTRLQLVDVVLSDRGSVAAADGTEHRRPDVICPLRPVEARALAERLLALAAEAEERTPR
jgi:hypothetical protein